MYIISPRKIKVISNSAAKIPPKIPISCAVYNLSEVILSTKKKQSNVTKSKNGNELLSTTLHCEQSSEQFLKGKEAPCAVECGSDIFNVIEVHSFSVLEAEVSIKVATHRIL